MSDPREPPHKCSDFDDLSKRLVRAGQEFADEVDELKKTNDMLRDYAETWRSLCEDAREERDEAQREASDLRDELREAERRIAELERSMEGATT